MLGYNKIVIIMVIILFFLMNLSLKDYREGYLVLVKILYLVLFLFKLN